MHTVQVPASSANLGPGFDCLGLAVSVYLRVSCEERPSGLVVKANEAGIALDERNLVVRAIFAVFAAAGRTRPGLSVDIENGIPLSRGLGSSAAAISAGLVLGNELLGRPYDRGQLLRIGLPLEGHPDNLAPALFGGLQVSSVAEDGEVVRVGVAMPRPPDIALFIPDFLMSTSEARRVLPDSFSKADAVFNTGRSSLLVAALAAGDFGALRRAMEDRIHQPYRASIFPDLPRLISAALEAGAAGAALSGAGSTVVALCEADPSPVAEAMAALGVPGRATVTSVDVAGASVS
ncbi:MAG TPA: homoserine kinase [Dehalococcoidia bacterium]|nr:homoserine kinase [Dehalococcoidia bacterium]